MAQRRKHLARFQDKMWGCFRPHQNRPRPNLEQFRSIPVAIQTSVCQCRANIECGRPDDTKCGPRMVTRIRPNLRDLADAGQDRHELDLIWETFWPNEANNVPEVSHRWSSSNQCWPKSARIRSELASHGPSWEESRLPRQPLRKVWAILGRRGRLSRNLMFSAATVLSPSARHLIRGPLACSFGSGAAHMPTTCMSPSLARHGPIRAALAPKGANSSKFGQDRSNPSQ